MHMLSAFSTLDGPDEVWQSSLAAMHCPATAVREGIQRRSTSYQKHANQATDANTDAVSEVGTGPCYAFRADKKWASS